MDAKDTWGRFAGLYLNANELDAYAETCLQLTKYLAGRKEYREARDQLDQAAVKCRERGSSRLVLKLLQKRVEIAKEAGDHRGIADSYSQLALSYESSEPLRAFENLHNAAMAYLEARDEEKAAELFERAYKMAPAVMAPVEIGWYCYKDVASDEYVFRGMFKESFKWVSNASIHFLQDPDASTKRLEAHWKEHDVEVRRLVDQLKSTESGPRQRELEVSYHAELRSRGLAEITLSKILAPSSRDKAQRWREASKESFREAGDENALEIL